MSENSEVNGVAGPAGFPAFPAISDDASRVCSADAGSERTVRAGRMVAAEMLEQPAWSTDLPAASGWSWWWVRLDSEDDDPVCLRVVAVDGVALAELASGECEPVAELAKRLRMATGRPVQWQRAEPLQ